MANASFPHSYNSPSSSSSSLTNANDYSNWYQPPQPQPQLQAQSQPLQQHEPSTFEPTPTPTPEPDEPASAQPLPSPESLRIVYEQPPPLPMSEKQASPPLDNIARARLRREKAKEKERQRPGVSALLPDEIIIDPPHDPDEKVTGKYVRSCSMARQDIPQGMRCVVMLRADYVYRMCEGCRMRFKLAEVRSKGIRYQGKFKARGQKEDARGSRFSKARMQRLVFHPNSYHSFSLGLT